MHIYLVQHGKALAEEQNPQRPLSEEGRAETERIAQALATRSARLLDPPISEIRHSGKLRARQTAEILAAALCPQASLTVGQGMNPNDNPQTVYQELAAGRDRPGAIMLVGHLPHLARLTGILLCGDVSKTPVWFANAGVVKISFREDQWAVDWFLTPSCI